MNEELVIDHWQNPVGKGPLPGATHSGFAINPGCGDTLRLDFRLVDGIMEGAGFDGKGCVMSLAGGSLLVEWLREQRPTAEWLVSRKLLTPDEMREVVRTLYGGLPIPVRMGCVMLPLLALQNAHSIQD